MSGPEDRRPSAVDGDQPATRRIEPRRGARWGWIVGFVMFGFQAGMMSSEGIAVDDPGYRIRALASAFVLGGLAGWIVAAFWDWTDRMRTSAALGAVAGVLMGLMYWIADASWRQPLPDVLGDLFVLVLVGSCGGGFMGALVWGIHEYGAWVGQNPMR